MSQGEAFMRRLEFARQRGNTVIDRCAVADLPEIDLLKKRALSRGLRRQTAW
jgi:hypothetical protein